MTASEMQALLRRYRVLAILVGSMIKDPLEREERWFQIRRMCGLPVREFLAHADPDEDPSLYLMALQTIEALREQQLQARRIMEGQPVEFSGRWN